MSRFKTRIKYTELRLLLVSSAEVMEFIAYVNDIKRSLTMKFRQLVLSAGDQIWSLGPLFVSAS
ncbi:hypothetical protein CDL12_08841 [Handroanthus impetiginosus]|uniref:Uncharacterized protein n=1 Tax=Handroanthus impetiginosus TaxID=429701 RepID=A0A2G9HLU0_9LAMI|nr:hypothetical protein CDL12_08841 [Handroanthus impetiginosus]